MENNLTALLIDTISIQEYIFSSNRLKDNIGASFIVEECLKAEIVSLIEELNKGENIEHEWKENPDEILLKSKTDLRVEIGYIGGGKTMLLFQNENTAKEFISKLSLKLLEAFPGLRTAYGLISDFDINNFKESQARLAKSLAENKSKYYSVVSVPSHGITADCSISGKVAEYLDNGRFISNEIYTKRTLSDKDTRWANFLTNHPQYLFPENLDYINDQKEVSYIAVVHVDGNNMGKQFINCESLPELRRKSNEVSQTCQNAFEKLLNQLSGSFDEDGYLCVNGERDESFRLKKTSDEKKFYLPIRPLINAGDDITFVCDGRLGVYVAEKLIQFLEESAQTSINSCAGVAIVKTKYPFARAYELTKELTHSAKKESKKNENKSYLEFLISPTGFTGSLANIRKRYFMNAEGDNLHFGPYLVLKSNIKDYLEDNYLEALKKRTYFFQVGGGKQGSSKNKKIWPKSKVMELRSVLFQSKEDRKYFLVECKANGRELPKVSNSEFKEKIINNQKSPYLEVIELMDFYPKILMQ